MRLFSLAILAMMFSSGAALACSCSDVTPRSCNLLANRDVSIFVGTVVSVENPPKEGDNQGGTARYHFRVDEWLSPDARGEVEVLSGRGGADCSFWFETGIPYLVFAYRGDNGELRASVCSNTQPVVDAGSLLTQLRAMHNGKPVARVYGTVRQVQQPYEATYQPDFAKIGIAPGQDFDASKLDPAVAKGLAAVPKPAQDKIMAWMKEGVATGDWKLSDGWIYSTKMGVYGTNYRWRALTGSIAIGANLAEDAVYPLSYGPDMLTTYSGAHKYAMHFNNSDFPPVEGFWSLTMYDEQQFLVPNPINRYNASERNKFKTNADGSVDIYIQNDSPGKDKEQNWLPAPKDKFMLTLRMYRPKEKSPSVLNGTWKIPPIKKIS